MDPSKKSEPMVRAELRYDSDVVRGIFEGDLDTALQEIPEISELSSDTQIIKFLQDTVGEAAREDAANGQSSYKGGPGGYLQE